jgi:hypothetical protein
MNYNLVWDVWGNLYRTRFRQVGGRNNGKVSNRLGVVRRGKYIRRVRVGSLGCIRWPSLFLEFLQQWFPGFAEVEVQDQCFQEREYLKNIYIYASVMGTDSVCKFI